MAKHFEITKIGKVWMLSDGDEDVVIPPNIHMNGDLQLHGSYITVNEENLYKIKQDGEGHIKMVKVNTVDFMAESTDIITENKQESQFENKTFTRKETDAHDKPSHHKRAGQKPESGGNDIGLNTENSSDREKLSGNINTQPNSSTSGGSVPKSGGVKIYFEGEQSQDFDNRVKHEEESQSRTKAAYTDIANAECLNERDDEDDDNTAWYSDDTETEDAAVIESSREADKNTVVEGHQRVYSHMVPGAEVPESKVSTCTGSDSSEYASPEVRFGNTTVSAEIGHVAELSADCFIYLWDRRLIQEVKMTDNPLLCEVGDVVRQQWAKHRESKDKFRTFSTLAGDLNATAIIHVPCKDTKFAFLQGIKDGLLWADSQNMASAVIFFDEEHPFLKFGDNIASATLTSVQELYPCFQHIIDVRIVVEGEKGTFPKICEYFTRFEHDVRQQSPHDSNLECLHNTQQEGQTSYVKTEFTPVEGKQHGPGPHSLQDNERFSADATSITQINTDSMNLRKIGGLWLLTVGDRNIKLPTEIRSAEIMELRDELIHCRGHIYKVAKRSERTIVVRVDNDESMPILDDEVTKIDHDSCEGQAEEATTSEIKQVDDELLSNTDNGLADKSLRLKENVKQYDVDSNAELLSDHEKEHQQDATKLEEQADEVKKCAPMTLIDDMAEEEGKGTCIDNFDTNTYSVAGNSVKKDNTDTQLAGDKNEVQTERDITQKENVQHLLVKANTSRDISNKDKKEVVDEKQSMVSASAFQISHRSKEITVSADNACATKVRPKSLSVVESIDEETMPKMSSQTADEQVTRVLPAQQRSIYPINVDPPDKLHANTFPKPIKEKAKRITSGIGAEEPTRARHVPPKESVTGKTKSVTNRSLAPGNITTKDDAERSRKQMSTTLSSDNKQVIHTPRSKVVHAETMTKMAHAAAYTERKQNERNIKQFQTAEGIHVFVYVGDILQAPVDCIVSASNDVLQHGGGVAKVIARAAGYELNRDSSELIRTSGPRSVGSACTTTAGKLQYRCVVHAIGPCWSHYNPHTLTKVQQCQADLQSAIMNSFKAADEMKLTSIALPAVSSAIFGVPMDICTYSYANAILDYSRKTKPAGSTLRTIHFCDVKMAVVKQIQEMFDVMIRLGEHPDFDIRRFVVREEPPRVISSSTPPNTEESRAWSSKPFMQSPIKRDAGKTWKRDLEQHTLPNAAARQKGEMKPGGSTPHVMFKFSDKHTVHAVQCDIFETQVDAIVSTEGTQCSGSRLIAKQLTERIKTPGYLAHKRAQVRKQGRQPGDVIVTSGFDSGFKTILHVVVPRMGIVTEESYINFNRFAYACYKSIFKAASTHGESVAMELIETVGYSTEGSAGAFCRGFNDFCGKGEPLKVYLVCKERSTLQRIEQACRRGLESHLTR